MGVGITAGTKVGNGVAVVVVVGALMAVGVRVTAVGAVAAGAGMTVAVGLDTGVWVEVGVGADTGGWAAGSSTLTPTANTENPGVSAT